MASLSHSSADADTYANMAGPRKFPHHLACSLLSVSAEAYAEAEASSKGGKSKAEAEAEAYASSSGGKSKAEAYAAASASSKGGKSRAEAAAYAAASSSGKKLLNWGESGKHHCLQVTMQVTMQHLRRAD
jgi:hypothetical protein